MPDNKIAIGFFVFPDIYLDCYMLCNVVLGETYWLHLMKTTKGLCLLHYYRLSKRCSKKTWWLKPYLIIEFLLTLLKNDFYLCKKTIWTQNSISNRLETPKLTDDPYERLYYSHVIPRQRIRERGWLRYKLDGLFFLLLIGYRMKSHWVCVQSTIFLCGSCNVQT